MDTYWEQNGHAPHPVKYESEAAVAGFPYCADSSLNFSTSGTAYSEDDAEYPTGRRNKTSRQDPLSHRIIEKRRRDRMNSCLADLSRLIPPQYQRKGRGRIEKTEIIEMAIRHLKHLQNECVHKEIEYKLGYSDCMKEVAKFLYESHMQDCCYRLLAHLQEHCDEIMKGECFKNRCNVETISASSGSPAQNTNYHNSASVPISQLRDMLTSDIEHSSDHNDIKDLSFRNNSQHHQQHQQNPQQQQTAVITTTATTTPSSIHHDSSNHDFDSSRDVSHHENEISSPPPQSNLHLLSSSASLIANHHHSTVAVTTSSNIDKIILKPIRLRNFSESSHDIEHNNNYKYKNHIKERFNHDVTHLHDESANDHCIPAAVTNQNDQKSDDGVDVDIISTLKKRKLEKLIDKHDIKIELNNNNSSSNCLNNNKIPNGTLQNNNQINLKNYSVPIFALHGQGTFYVPLNIDYESLLPYLNGIDLIDKNICPPQILHPININVNFSINQQQQLQQQQSFIGITKPINCLPSVLFPRSKLEKNNNGW